MQDDGPKDLDKLIGMLPSFIKGVENGEIGGKGRPARAPIVACGICGKSHDQRAGEKAGVSTCLSCASLLKEGYTALVCIVDSAASENKFAFVKSERLADKAGQIMRISPEVMAKIWHAKEIQQEREHE